jgi:glucose-1-phosphate thymidylyltransferase
VIGIVLAGGTGSRLWPITLSVSKQLVPVYDKPLIYYPIATLMTSGIREIIVITSEREAPQFRQLLGDGSQFGIKFNYAIQSSPRGIADAFNVVADQISGEKVALILGDNIFHGQGLGRNLQKYTDVEGAQVFGYQVSDPSQYGIAEFDGNNKVVNLVEKPDSPISNIAIPGLYFYDEQVLSIVDGLKPSKRNELEITDVNREYLRLGKLNLEILPRGTAWLDTGTTDSLVEASSYIQIVEKRQGLKIACLEEIALKMEYIGVDQLDDSIQKFGTSPYGFYLREVKSQFLGHNHHA